MLQIRKIFQTRFLPIMVDNKPWCQKCYSSWYKLWKTSAIGSHNLFWIKTYKLVFLCKNCSWYISWVRKYISIVGEIWSKVSKGCTTNAQCKLKILLSILTQRLPSFTNYITSDDPEQIMSLSKGMLFFGVQFLWEVIGSNFSTSESAMTPKLLHREWNNIRILWA